jgi:hypothetical protein
MAYIVIDMTDGIIQNIMSDIKGVEFLEINRTDRLSDDDASHMELVDSYERKFGARVVMGTANFNPKLVGSYFKQASDEVDEQPFR